MSSVKKSRCSKPVFDHPEEDGSTKVIPVSYGQSAPLQDNSSSQGRAKTVGSKFLFTVMELLLRRVPLRRRHHQPSRARLSRGKKD